MLYVVDNFLKDPYAVRNTALKCTYGCVSPRYPGIRSDDVPRHVSDYILKEMSYLVKRPLGLANSSFQYVGKEFGDGIYHYDDDYQMGKGIQYSCFIYLTPEPPANSGTEVCDVQSRKEFNQCINSNEYFNAKEKFHLNPKNLVNRYRYSKVKRKVASLCTPMAIIPNKFNRLVIFDAYLNHRAQNFFGSSIENGRLTLVSFLSGEHMIRG